MLEVSRSSVQAILFYGPCFVQGGTVMLKQEKAIPRLLLQFKTNYCGKFRQENLNVTVYKARCHYMLQKTKQPKPCKATTDQNCTEVCGVISQWKGSSSQRRVLCLSSCSRRGLKELM